ncbi:type IX secretion system sortase PorU [Cesiribacter andamanensis]|uniref:Peptidase family C25 n=1 Tax=Cesiribacter andamanensis AMV16 TaxID=1279009 RepID=M7NBI7_9BACT|nr:type IX secretion system sortase PorU [Cesiribacter andamanensis]EMR04556.1 Peptidase family C25 [Cesiribacter andamanensis AMV16]
MPWRVLFLLICCLCLSVPLVAQQQSILAEGSWYRLGVTESGVYRLSTTYLRQHGILPEGADPRLLQIRGWGGGMLPEPIASPRPQDLPQLAIEVQGEEKGRLSEGDFVLFYAQGPDLLQYDPGSGWYTHQKNIYSDTAYYFIGLGPEPGLRIGQLPNLGHSLPLITSHEGVDVYEKDEVNLIQSGRRWFSDGFGYTPSRSYTTRLQELTAGTLRLQTVFVNAHESAVTFSVRLAGQPVQSLQLRGVDPYQYANKGWIGEEKTQIASSSLPAATSPLPLEISLTGSTSGNRAYLDYYLLQAPVRLRYRAAPLHFLAPQSLQHPSVTYQLADAPAGLRVWDITSPEAPMLQHSSQQGGALLFGAASSQLRSYIAFAPATAPEPRFAGRIANQNLRADLQPELVIISHPSLLAEARRLAAFRQSHDGLSTKVVTPQQVYNEFSSGRQDVTAIRDYMRHLYVQGGGRLRYLLLFGKGYYDYKGRTPQNYNLVPLYESYNSTHPISSWASDDFYGFLEDGEGDWVESESGNQSLEIGIGRLPVITPAEAKEVVDKLIAYSSEPSGLGGWRQRILFVADDDDGNVHQLDAERLSRLAQGASTPFNLRKLYLDAFPKLITPNSQTAPAARDALLQALDQGALIVNYTGHGSRDFWAAERIFSKSLAEGLKNKDRLPLIVTATCEFGLHDGPIRSGAEALLLNPRGGAIGLLTTSRPVFSHTNFQINSAFYANALPQKASEQLRLGDIMRRTKNEGVPGSGINNRNFVLLGDPSLQLAYPRQPAVVTAISSASGATDTLRAYEELLITGSILRADSSLDENFTGSLLATVYDKSDELSTLGQTAPPIQYTQRQNVLFRGETRVTAGRFSIAMVVPKNIRYELGAGRIELYATHADGRRDAGGAIETILVGGSAPAFTPDRTPPSIQLYLNDTTFVSGNPVGREALLLARLQDLNGISISYTGMGQNLEAVLNDTLTWVLNDYYTSVGGDYRQGWVRFPLQKLQPGQQQLRLRAWDTHGNMQEAELSFFVPAADKITISRLHNYPNPFTDQTTFVVTHNRAGDALEATLFLYGPDGRLQRRFSQQLGSATGTLELAWDSRGENLTPGLYVMKVLLRSLSDGSVAEKAEKLVIQQ